jgi:hypothetical protein
MIMFLVVAVSMVVVAALPGSGRGAGGFGGYGPGFVNPVLAAANLAGVGSAVMEGTLGEALQRHQGTKDLCPI